MARVCTVCAHTGRRSIGKCLVSEQPNRSIAKQFGLDDAAVFPTGGREHDAIHERGVAMLETVDAVLEAITAETRRFGVRWRRVGKSIRCSMDDALRLLQRTGHAEADAGDVEDCSSPLTFLLLARTGRLRDWTDAIDMLRMPGDVARRILAAADAESGELVELNMRDDLQVVMAADRASLLKLLKEPQN
jgi:hypothetical protein